MACYVFYVSILFMFLFLVRFNSDKTDLESTHSSNASSGIDKSHQVIPPDALYSMKNSNAGYISYEAMFNDSKVSFYHIVNSCNKKESFPTLMVMVPLPVTQSSR